uniref:Uncharacterized protein n=1 Tax=Glossina brevipalpis TaxID=37001 RepID=A0A1A9X4R0_9MUSC
MHLARFKPMPENMKLKSQCQRNTTHKQQINRVSCQLRFITNVIPFFNFKFSEPLCVECQPTGCTSSLYVLLSTLSSVLDLKQIPEIVVKIIIIIRFTLEFTTAHITQQTQFSSDSTQLILTR